MGKRQKRGRKSSRGNPDRLDNLITALENIQRADVQTFVVYLQIRVIQVALTVHRNRQRAANWKHAQMQKRASKNDSSDDSDDSSFGYLSQESNFSSKKDNDKDDHDEPGNAGAGGITGH